ncbi:NADH-quinone oxidoreductase subunit G [Caldicoprobacter guelmensis]|uniref:[FeFe] hydrogenase, group A n=1 Tax=Caldicoprobacter guelmensis TaxID=1170224 RepID=UPI00195666C8|nr:[FeFe] hydrogenase, group A [Caldicoprobacter guelmensis]MBM7582808.1 NADH-quinone oxidoreductase subunit G [Caldicoprobacter guelmensis]
MAGTMVIDGQRVQFDKEKNILDVIRKAGIDLPTFCYYSELSIYGACRMCMVEDERGRPMAACSTPPKDGMVIKTNTPKLQKYRRMVLELILSSHDRDCTLCEKNGKCKLQELAARFNIRNMRFEPSCKQLPVDESSTSIVRNPNKCIMCGDCVRMCEEVQGIGVLGFAYRGSKIKVTTAFEKPIADVECVSCGQCAAVCPTGAIVVKNETYKVWSVLNDKTKRVVAQIAPAVRVALGEEFGLAPGAIVTGKIVAALRKLGFDEVYDTGLAADLTVMEESREFIDRLGKKEDLPLFTSCCPAWVKFAENRYPQLLKNISTCKSPQQIFGSLIKEHYSKIDRAEGKETVVVSIMPCTAKKYEATRPEYTNNGVPDVDVVITTQELALMIRQAGIVFGELEPESLDMPFGLSSGSGVIFGVTGGVAEAVIRRCLKQKSPGVLKDISFSGIRGMDGIKEAAVDIDGQKVNVAVVNGLRNVDKLVKSILSGEKKYDFVEVMACPGGCIGGAGRPIPQSAKVKTHRAKGLYDVDRAAQIKRSEENPIVMALYSGLLSDKRHLMHRCLDK